MLVTRLKRLRSDLRANAQHPDTPFSTPQRRMQNHNITANTFVSHSSPDPGVELPHNERRQDRASYFVPLRPMLAESAGETQAFTVLLLFLLSLSLSLSEKLLGHI